MIFYSPDPGTAVTPTPASDSGPTVLQQITDWADTIPGWAWAAIAAALLTTTLITLPIARRLAYRAGRRAAGHTTATDRRDRALLAAALAPAGFFWLAVLAGSFRGLVAFGRDDLDWHDGGEYLVPATLDGVAISFAVLAFRAIKKRRSPDRAVRIAWGASLAGAVINFGHEASQSALGGAYLALMSVLGMLIFDELLAQFEDGTDQILRKRPKFGLRWVTYTPNTLCAALAWINHPPVDGTPATVANAVDHLEQVRADKQTRRAAAVLAGVARPWWAPIVPWAHAARLDAALAEHTRSVASERAEWSSRLEQVTADHEIAVQRAEHLAEQLSAALAERVSEQADAARAEQQIEALRRQVAGQAEQIAAMATGVSAARPEQSRRTGPASAKTSGNAGRSAPKLTDEQAVEEMLRAHPEPGYEWGPREVHRLTGAGFGRVQKLIAAVAEHHARSGRPEQPADAGDDDAEHAGAAVSA